MTKNENKVGRPLKYGTAEELQKAIDLFFHDCPDKRKIITQTGVEIEIPCPTISGLAYYLGFLDRQSLYDYEERAEFSCIIKKARLFVEKEYEKLLHNNNVTGIIFALKNMGWGDKIESENVNHDDIIVRWEK
jgi:hypothetical protein